MTIGADLSSEEKFVWLEDIDRLDYVREVRLFCRSKQGRPAGLLNSEERLVGYAVLKKDAPNNTGVPGRFYRRAFVLRTYDRPDDPGGVYRLKAPTEAVDPRTVAPGVKGQITDRAWNGVKEHPSVEPEARG